MNFNEIINLTRPEMTEAYNSGNRDPVENVKFDKKAASSFSASRRDKRHLITDKIFPKGYNTYDLHSAGIAIQRLMNTGEFDPDYDIKDDIEKETGADRDMIKQVLVKTQYHKDPENVKASVERHNPDMDMSKFDDVYESFVKIIGHDHGDVSLYGTEAEIELLTNIVLREMGYHTANVFDCFYSEAPEELIKETLTKVAKAYYEVHKGDKIRESMIQINDRIKSLREAGLHTTHLEDSFLKGTNALTRMMNFYNFIFATLEGSYTGTNPPISQKIDGGPVISIWTSFPGLKGPGCAGKGLFNKTQSTYFTHEDIDQEDKPDGYKIKLHHVLDLAKAVKLPPNEIWTGDMLFSEGDAQEYSDGKGEKFVYVKPVTIAYAAPAGTELANKFKSCKVGAVFHTRYRNSLANKTNDIDISEATNIPEWAFIRDAQIKDLSGKVSFTKKESAYIRKEIDNLGEFVDNILKDPEYHDLISNDQFIDFYIMTLQNHKVDEQTPIDAKTFTNELQDWIKVKMDKERSGIEKLKTESGRLKKSEAINNKSKELSDLATKHKRIINKVAEGLALATEIKSYFITKINEADEWISQIEMKDGFHNTSGEGFIASDIEGNFVKLVDRTAFSFFGRSSDIIKGGAHSSSKIQESDDKRKDTAVVCFSRMNPPTIGHKLLAKKIRDIAEIENGQPFIFLSHSYDGIESPKFKMGKTRNPLQYDDKIGLVQDAIGDIVTVVESDLNGTFEVYSDLNRKGFNHLVIVAGQDRIGTFEKDAVGHNGQPDKEPKRYFDFASVKGISAGDRNEDSDDPLEKMSASFLRKCVVENNYDEFEKGAGTETLTREMFDLLKHEMGINRLQESDLSIEEKRQYVNDFDDDEIEDMPVDDEVVLAFPTEEEATAAVTEINNDAQTVMMQEATRTNADDRAKTDQVFKTRTEAESYIAKLKNKYYVGSYSADVEGGDKKYYVTVKLIKDQSSDKIKVKASKSTKANPAEAKKAIPAKATSVGSSSDLIELPFVSDEDKLKSGFSESLNAAVNNEFIFRRHSDTGSNYNVYTKEGKTMDSSDFVKLSKLLKKSGLNFGLNIDESGQIHETSNKSVGSINNISVDGKRKSISIRKTGQPLMNSEGQSNLSSSLVTAMQEALTALCFNAIISGVEPPKLTLKYLKDHLINTVQTDDQFRSFNSTWGNPIMFATKLEVLGKISDCFITSPSWKEYIAIHSNIKNYDKPGVYEQVSKLYDLLYPTKIGGKYKDTVNPSDIFFVKKSDIININLNTGDLNEYIKSYNDLLYTKSLIGVSLKKVESDGKVHVSSTSFSSFDHTSGNSEVMNPEKMVAFYYGREPKDWTIQKVRLISTGFTVRTKYIEGIGNVNQDLFHNHQDPHKGFVQFDIRLSNSGAVTPTMEASVGGLPITARLGKAGDGIKDLFGLDVYNSFKFLTSNKGGADIANLGSKLKKYIVSNHINQPNLELTNIVPQDINGVYGLALINEAVKKSEQTKLSPEVADRLLEYRISKLFAKACKYKLINRTDKKNPVDKDTYAVDYIKVAGT